MSLLVPGRFLVRLCLPCPYVKRMPSEKPSGLLLDLPEANRLHTHPAVDDVTEFADVRVGWNELGLGVQVSVGNKTIAPVGDVSRPRSSDGLTLWLDTRDTRTSHRASRYCHQFHFLATGGGPKLDQPAFQQTKINRAQQDAPLAAAGEVSFHAHLSTNSYKIEAFLPTTLLSGYDPDQHPRLGICYAVHDQEHGTQYLTVSADFPIADDPSLWQTMELMR